MVQNRNKIAALCNQSGSMKLDLGKLCFLTLLRQGFSNSCRAGDSLQATDHNSRCQMLANFWNLVSSLHPTFVFNNSKIDNAINLKCYFRYYINYSWKLC